MVQMCAYTDMHGTKGATDFHGFHRQSNSRNSMGVNPLGSMADFAGVAII